MPHKCIEKQIAEWHKKIANQEKDGGFLLNGSRAVSESAVESWLRKIIESAYSLGKSECIREQADIIKHHFNGFGGVLGFTRGQLLDLLNKLKK